ncbi:hypothetical protein GSI_09430 [Ganoderma sinense ZZ0214-1]|uniref:Bromo domain-containing protein n=1 Tax=Ganoderma sinense ZZ0214-1 TaxID=1077348 RepID=A0A2G8S757_9APHY|nr:hypothetical protein GSI_09430 [Ganoderma sinense ZZ0214-1]
MSTPLDPLSPQSHIAVTPPAIRGSPSVLVPRLFKTGSPPPAPISPPPNGNIPAEPPGPSTFSAAQWCFSSSIIRTLRRMKTAGPFLNPVDPLELGIPHYPQVIERPMDFSTIERKLAASYPSKPDPNPTYARYYRVDQFVQDVRLVFANSVKFNGPEHPVTRMGKQVERIFDKQIKQMRPRKRYEPSVHPEAPMPVAGPPLFPPPSSSTSSPPSSPPPKKRARRPPVPVVLVIRRNKEPTGRPKREIRPPPRKDVLYTATSPALFKDKAPKNAVAAEQLKFCEKIWKELHQKQHYWVAHAFYRPVDPVNMGIPEYPNFVKKPMDLSTMKKKLDAGEYSTAEKFRDDFKLMIKNCTTFNPPSNPVHEAGKALQHLFDEKWKNLPVPRSHDASDEEDEDNDESGDERARMEGMIADMESQIATMKNNLATLERNGKEETKRD